MPASSDPDNSIRQSLPRAANIWVNRAKGKAKTTRIKGSFTISAVASEGNGRYSITISNAAPEAPAYEYGSGIHRTKGQKAKYLIPNVPGVVLRIPRSRWPNYEPPPDVDPVYLTKVMHPGVEPEPFMKPAFDEVRGEMRQVIGHSFAVEVVHKSIRDMWKVG